MQSKNGSGLILIEKYDKFLHYIYPILQEIPRKHGILKEKTILLVFQQADLIYKLVKSKPLNKTRLYELDAGIATVRHHLRFLAETKNIVVTFDKKQNKQIKKNANFLLNKKRHGVASILIAEVGKILGSILKNKNT